MGNGSSQKAQKAQKAVVTKGTAVAAPQGVDTSGYEPPRVCDFLSLSRGGNKATGRGMPLASPEAIACTVSPYDPTATWNKILKPLLTVAAAPQTTGRMEVGTFPLVLRTDADARKIATGSGGGSSSSSGSSGSSDGGGCSGGGGGGGDGGGGGGGGGSGGGGGLTADTGAGADVAGSGGIPGNGGHCGETEGTEGTGGTEGTEQRRLTGLTKAPAEGMVRFVCISDTHGMHERIPCVPAGDVLIHAGDITNTGEPEQFASVSHC